MMLLWLFWYFGQSVTEHQEELIFLKQQKLISSFIKYSIITTELESYNSL
jgi:hypothetical protein